MLITKIITKETVLREFFCNDLGQDGSMGHTLQQMFTAMFSARSVVGGHSASLTKDASLNQLVIVLEHVPGGDCLDLLHASDGFLDESLVGRLVQQLLVAVAYCHSRDIVHRDIKPDLAIGQSPPLPSPCVCFVFPFLCPLVPSWSSCSSVFLFLYLLVLCLVMFLFPTSFFILVPCFVFLLPLSNLPLSSLTFPFFSLFSSYFSPSSLIPFFSLFLHSFLSPSSFIPSFLPTPRSAL